MAQFNLKIAGVKIWNDFPSKVKSLHSFKMSLRGNFFKIVMSFGIQK